ncbi:MAG: diacylglycerol kinase family lipid kinase [Acidobacteria bacterium]|nr:diacylglycerol kinase family lipid kinase [Acidobacteriota bacterium]
MNKQETSRVSEVQCRNSAAVADTFLDVIINTTSGAGADEGARLRVSEIFRSSGYHARILLAGSGTEVVELARRAARGTSMTVVAGGGDGTINAVASELLSTDKALGVLPLGTFNHFAKDLHIPLDIEEAVRTIIAGHSVRIDTGEVNGRIFLNNSSLGLYPSIVDQRDKHQRMGYGKWPAFFRAMLTVLRRYPFLHVRLKAGEQEFEGHTPFVFIGNNEYEMESLNIGRRMCLNGGKLCLYMTHRLGRLGLLQLALRALFGRLREAEDFIALCTEEIWVETRRKYIRVSMDGEVAVMMTPLRYRIRPGVLRVFVPEDVEQDLKG